MRRVRYSVAMSLDGYIAGPNGEFDWIILAAASTAETAGFRKGDLIVKVNDYSIFNRERYLGAIGTYPENTEVKIRVKRNDETADLKVELERFDLREPKQAMSRPKGSGYLGAYVDETKDGLKVGDIRPASPADVAGLQNGDLILAINERKIGSRDELLQRLYQRKPGAKIKLTIKRDAQELELEVVLGRHPDDE